LIQLGPFSRRKGASVDEFIRLTTTEGIESGGLKAVSHRDEDGDHDFLVANVGGEYLVADGRCPHMGGDLSKGELAGTVITCPRHHSQFDLRDGRVLRWTDWEGATLTIGTLLRHPRALRAYEVRVEGNDVLVGPQKTPPAAEQ
jgi:3-phenylpropionate/trans-cinnamate dioxygenase ferredoxin component